MFTAYYILLSYPQPCYFPLQVRKKFTKFIFFNACPLIVQSFIIMRAKSIKGNSPENIRSALLSCMADGFKPTLAIVFISIKQDRQAVCELLTREGISVIGATSCGEFINGHQSEGETVMLLLEMDTSHFYLVFEDTHGKDLPEAARRITAEAMSRFRRPGFILCSSGISVEGEIYDGKTLVHLIETVSGGEIPVFGGMAGDDSLFTGTYVFNNTQATDKGFIALVLDQDKIQMHGMAVSGWKPLGTIRMVTKSEDGWLYAIDDQPALDLYLRYLGKKPVIHEGFQKDFFVDIGFSHPFLCYGAGDPVIRTPMMVDAEKNAIKLDFPIPVGGQIQFTLPPDFDIVEAVLDEAAQLKKEEKAEADALLIFSCVGRLAALGPMTQEENEGLTRIWNAPMAGYYSYGEYGRGKDGRHGIHSTTNSWVTLKEKENDTP